MSDTLTKTEDGQSFPAEAFAYRGDDAKPSTWKLRLWASPDAKETAAQVGRAIAALSPGGFRGKKANIPAASVPVAKKRIYAAWKKVHPDEAAADAPASIKESVADMTFSDRQERVENAIRQWLVALDDQADGGVDDETDQCESLYQVWVSDMTDTWAVFRNYGDLANGPGLYRVAYTMADDGTVTLGAPEPVVKQTSYAPAATTPSPVSDETVPATESVTHDGRMPVRVHGRIIEAKGVDEQTGGRIFGVQIIAFGDSKNRRRYPEATMRKAVSKYEGAKAYDHHRTTAEMSSGAIAGLVGSYRNVQATSEGLDADLYLLPSATHTAEALDASLEAQAQGLPPLVGVSHDVYADFKPFVKDGLKWQEATEIVKVNSADVVADPAAGGRATRMVAGGSGDPEDKEPEVAITTEDVAAALAEATDEDKQRLREALGVPADPTAGGEGEKKPEGGEKRTTESDETEYSKGSTIGRLVVSQAIEAQALDAKTVDAVTRLLPDRFTEADVATAIEGFTTLRDDLARAGLAPTVPDAAVTKDEADRKIEALDAMFAGDFRKGYKSFRTAWADITGNTGRLGALDTEDVNRRILRESIGSVAYDSDGRALESVVASTWNLILGDSITRRMVAEYAQPALTSWQKVVSSVVPLNDFRTQRIDRLGGYGTLPTVNEGAPYQPLTTPGNEEATYAPAKRGGTEDLTLETIANDDLRSVMRIPKKLGLAAAQTLFRFVWDFLDTNATCTYDSTAVFAAGHGSNTATNALSGGAVSTGRKTMRKQTAYGDTKDLLSIVPATLVVVSDLEELAWQIANSAVAMPSGAPVGAASNIPNIHAGIDVVTVDYWTSTTKWMLAADPNLIPLLELGFYQGRQDPELFVQNDPTVGSVFTSDKITYKIRHIYGGTVLDHRGLYRGNV